MATNKRNLSSLAADHAAENSILLSRVSETLRRDAFVILENLSADLAGRAGEFAKLSAPAGQRFKQLSAEVNAIIGNAYKEVSKTHRQSLLEVADSQSMGAANQLNAALKVDVFNKRLNPKVLESIVDGKIIMGHAASDWWAGQSADLRNKFSRQMAMGVLAGDSTPDMVKRVIGDLQYRDKRTGGIMQASKAQAEALVLTSVQAVANDAALRGFREMSTVKAIQWVSTLDGRTTVICIGLDGKQWDVHTLQPIGHNKSYPGGVAHFRCRSARIAVTKSWEELAGRKLPELDNKTLQTAMEEKMRARGWKEDKIQAAIAGTRASMDGQVSRDHTYESWAQSKGPEFMNQVMGPGKAELFKQGRISFADLTDQSNRPINLAQLKAAMTGNPPPETLGRQYNATPAALRQVSAISEEARAAAVVHVGTQLAAMASIPPAEWTQAQLDIWEALPPEAQKQLMKQWGLKSADF